MPDCSADLLTIQGPDHPSPAPDPARLRSIVLWALRVARERVAARKMRQAGGEKAALPPLSDAPDAV